MQKKLQVRGTLKLCMTSPVALVASEETLTAHFNCTDQIATLHIIIEQSIEFQSWLYLDFVDFEKAFDSVDHEVLWNLLGLYEVPDKVIRIIRLFSQDFSCQVIHSGSVTEPFTISTGVRQGYLLSPLLFLIVIDWVTNTAFNTPRGIRWTLTKRLEDLDFADDICMLAHRLQDAQEQLDHLRSTGLRAGLKINVSKTKTMRVNACLNNNIMLSGQAIEDVNEFTYLGSIVSPTGGTEEDKSYVERRRHNRLSQCCAQSGVADRFVPRRNSGYLT